MNSNFHSRCLVVVMTLFLLQACNTEKKVESPNKTKVDPVDLVYPQLDSENSRWLFFASASRPFGMVNLSPDTQIGGAWGSGYRYNTDTVKGFSHIHAWQLSGLSIMPVTFEQGKEKSIYNDFYSKFSHETEKVAPGYHYVELDRYDISVSLTSTRRVGFHKYKFPKSERAILFNLEGLLGPCKLVDGELKQVDANNLVGKVVNAPTIRRPKPSTVFFHVQLNAKIESIQKDEETGDYLAFFDDNGESEVLLKAAMSYTSIDNATNNMNVELPHWDFDQVVKESKEEWNEMLSRIEIEGGSEKDRKRFYTDLWHGLQGRRTVSDVNGAYADNMGDAMRIGQIPLDASGKPKFNHYNSDSFWGAQWTLTTLWGLVYPDIYEEFVHSLMQYYKDGGMVPRGPSGGNYSYVMTGATATPFIVSAIQKGIVKEGHEEIYEALKKGHMPGGIMARAGYEHKTLLGGGLDHYIQNGWVPYPIPEGTRFGYHQDGGSLTAEYAYQDWTLAQLALKIGNKEDAEYFLKRAKNYANVYDKESGWMRPRDVNGVWKQDFDPYQKDNGFNECNAAQSTWFVPHDPVGLAELMGGIDAAVEKLNAQFEEAEELGFTAGKAHADESNKDYSRIPINYGNQPSIQTAFMFHGLGRPDLTQLWSRKVVDKVFGGLGTNTGYNGDEDQGLMGSVAVLMKLGLFQLTGGTEENPTYLLGSPIFDKATIRLHPDYYGQNNIVISRKSANPNASKVRATKFKGQELSGFAVDHASLIGGGELVFEMEE